MGVPVLGGSAMGSSYWIGGRWTGSFYFRKLIFGMYQLTCIDIMPILMT
jgi:hypothetical protein